MYYSHFLPNYTSNPNIVIKASSATIQDKPPRYTTHHQISVLENGSYEQKQKKSLLNRSRKIPRSKAQLMRTSDSNIEESQIFRYQEIAKVMQDENRNLKQQNKYLSKKLKACIQKNKTHENIEHQLNIYKKLYQETLNKIEGLVKQCQAYKSTTEQLKTIAYSDIAELQKKFQPLLSNSTGIASNGSQNNEFSFDLDKDCLEKRFSAILHENM